MTEIFSLGTTFNRTSIRHRLRMEDSQTGGTALATGQFKVGPLFINLRVLLEALGFLRIVMVVSTVQL